MDNELMEALGDAYDEVSSSTEAVAETVDSEEAQADIEQPEAEQSVDAEAQDAELSEEEIAEAMAELEAEQGIQAPQHWSKEHRELFEAQSDEVKQFMLDRHKSMESDYTKKTGEIADFKKTWEPVANLFSAYPNVDPAGMIQNWANIAVSLEQNPLGTLTHLAQQYGVDLSGNMVDNEGQDPRINQLLNEINTLKSHVSQTQQQSQAEAVRQKEAEVEAFRNQKGEDGQLLHPFFEEAEGEMLRLINGFQAMGEPVPPLADLYDRAVNANPELREKVRQSSEAQAEIRKKAEAIARAKRAKIAGKSVESGAGVVETEGEASLRDTLAAAMR